MRKMTQKLERTNLMVLLQMRMNLTKLFMDIRLLYEVVFFWCCNGAFASDDASNVTKIGKDKSDDTHAYKDTTHKVILRTFSYFLNP